MITLFSWPRPFVGHTNTIQRNAIQSWTRLQPKPEIILIGNEEGVPEVVQEFDLRHIPIVEANDFGTLLLNSTFSAAENMASHNVMCFVNTDIILLNDFMKAVQRGLRLRPICLMISQRWNLDVNEPISFRSNWESGLKEMINRQGKFAIPNCIDTHVFSKGILGPIPPFAMGRFIYDDWLVAHARLKGIPVIDLTSVATVIHQNHAYSNTTVHRGEEAKRNIKLAKGKVFAFTAWDSDYKLTQKGLIHKSILYRFYGELVIMLEKYPALIRMLFVVRLCRESWRIMWYALRRAKNGLKITNKWF